MFLRFINDGISEVYSIIFLKIYFMIMLLQLSHFFSLLFPSALHHTFHQHSPTPTTYFMSMIRTYKFFGF